MHDRKRELAARLEDTGKLVCRARHLVAINRGHERDCEVDRLVLDGHIGGVRLDELELGAELTSSRYHLFRRIDPDNVVPARGEIAAQPSLPAADVECEPSRSRHELEEPISMKSPVTVVARLARPADPGFRIALPGMAQHRHEVCPSPGVL